MLYFSELNKIRIYSEDQKFVGFLDDLIFSLTGIPYIKRIVISPLRFNFLRILPNLSKKEKTIISVEDLVKINGNKIIVKKNFQPVTIGENELYVRENLLDTQVIDMEENNVVRVNDVLIQSFNSHGLVIYGVDIGILGILRWLRIEKLMNRVLSLFGKYFVHESSLAWSDIQPLELTRGRVVVNSRFDKLKKLHPADLADYLETQNFKNVMTLFEGIDKDYLAEVVSELNPSFQINLFKIMPLDKISVLISIMDPDDAVDVISQFSKKKQEIILENIPKKEASEIRRLLQFNDTPLGEYLNPEVLTVNPEDLSSTVIKKIRDQASDFSTLENVYIVNRENQLVGVFGLHELLLQKPDTPVFKFMMQRPVTVNLNTPIEIAFRRMSKYKIASLPVVDDKRQIIGTVLIEDLSREAIKRS